MLKTYKLLRGGIFLEQENNSFYQGARYLGQIELGPLDLIAEQLLKLKTQLLNHNGSSRGNPKAEPAVQNDGGLDVIHHQLASKKHHRVCMHLQREKGERNGGRRRLRILQNE